MVLALLFAACSESHAPDRAAEQLAGLAGDPLMTRHPSGFTRVDGATVPHCIEDSGSRTEGYTYVNYRGEESASADSIGDLLEFYRSAAESEGWSRDPEIVRDGPTSVDVVFPAKDGAELAIFLSVIDAGEYASHPQVSVQMRLEGENFC